jgi:hypothetical protein
MLSYNLWVQEGLFNGILGVFMQIVYEPGTNPPVIRLIGRCGH